MRKGATGFLYGYPSRKKQSDENSDFRLWLVTCAHVIETVMNLGHENILVRMNKSIHGEMKTFNIPLNDGQNYAWHFHPNMDVAVIASSPDDFESKGVDWEIFASGRNSLTKDECVQFGLSEGDGVFILGFPVGWREGKQDYPVVRHGVLAQVQGWFSGDHDTFLVDGSGFPGNSGGPVVTVPQVAAITGTRLNSRSDLIGMVSKGKNYKIMPKEPHGLEEWADLIKQLGLRESADLIEVVPVDAIDETIQLAMDAEEV